MAGKKKTTGGQVISVSISFKIEDKKLLAEYFAERGVDLSSGVRQILYRFMHQKGIKKYKIAEETDIDERHDEY